MNKTYRYRITIHRLCELPLRITVLANTNSAEDVERLILQKMEGKWFSVVDEHGGVVVVLNSGIRYVKVRRLSPYETKS